MEDHQLPVKMRAKSILDTDTEYNIGLMVLTTKDIGGTIKQKVKALSGMLKVMCTEANSRMIWLTDMENTLTLMEVSIRVSLKTMCKKETVKKNG